MIPNVFILRHASYRRHTLKPLLRHRTSVNQIRFARSFPLLPTIISSYDFKNPNRVRLYLKFNNIFLIINHKYFNAELSINFLYHNLHIRLFNIHRITRKNANTILWNRILSESIRCFGDDKNFGSESFSIFTVSYFFSIFS